MIITKTKRSAEPEQEQWINKIKTIESEVTNGMKRDFINSARTVCREFTVTPNIQNTLNILCKYFLGIEGDLSLNKGIFLVGGYGVGKSTIMMSMRRWLADNWNKDDQLGNGFMVTSVEEIIQDYKESKSLDRWVNNSEDDYRPGARHLLINEFGLDLKDKIYGVDSIRIINQLMKMRYDLFQNYGKLTHVTSNFDPNSDDEALMDRYFEMFNVIEIEGESFRK